MKCWQKLVWSSERKRLERSAWHVILGNKDKCECGKTRWSTFL